MSLILPTIFKNKGEKPEYDKYIGMPKLSYSQIQSWCNPDYKKDYFRTYFLNIPSEGSIFTEFGSACGTFIESIGKKDPECHQKYEALLSDFDRDVITANLKFPKNSVYEDYICLNVDDEFVIEGFADRVVYLPKNRIVVQDFKTGSIKNKSVEYGSNDYNQTRLYAYAKELEGYEVGKCEVILFDRKGNGSDKHPLRLTGDINIIPNEYNMELVNNFLNKARKVAKEISDTYQRYQRLLK